MPKQPPRQPQSRHPALRYTSQRRSPTPFALSLSKPVLRLRLSKGAHHKHPPPATPHTPHTPHPDTSPFPPTPPNPYPTPMNTAPHTATTTTKAPANTHARSAQSTPPLNPNRPPGLFRQKRNNQEMQPKQDSATQQPQRRGHPTLTRAPRANADAQLPFPHGTSHRLHLRAIALLARTARIDVRLRFGPHPREVVSPRGRQLSSCI